MFSKLIAAVDDITLHIKDQSFHFKTTHRAWDLMLALHVTLPDLLWFSMMHGLCQTAWCHANVIYTHALHGIRHSPQPSPSQTWRLARTSFSSRPWAIAHKCELQANRAARQTTPPYPEDFTRFYLTCQIDDWLRPLRQISCLEPACCKLDLMYYLIRCVQLLQDWSWDCGSGMHGKPLDATRKQ